MGTAVRPVKISLALELAKSRLARVREDGKEPSGEDVVFAALKMAADIKRRDKHVQDGERRPLAKELDMASEVLQLWRYHLTGNARDRDWLVLHALASGSTARDVAARASMTHARIVQIKQMQCRHIWHNVARYMPGVDPFEMALQLAESMRFNGS